MVYITMISLIPPALRLLFERLHCW